MKKFMVIAAIAAMMIACASKEEKYVDNVLKAIEAKDVKALIELNKDTAGLKLTDEQNKQIKEAMDKAAKEDPKFADELLKAALEAAAQQTEE